MENFTDRDIRDTADFFRISDGLARKIWEQKAFYDPITESFRDKSELLKGNVGKRTGEIEKWIAREEKRIEGFPGFDGIEPYIASAQDTVKMMKEHKKE